MMEIRKKDSNKNNSTKSNTKRPIIIAKKNNTTKSKRPNNNKPIVILNTDGFYDKLIEFFETLIQRNFANKMSRKLYYIAKTPSDAIEYINKYQPEEIDSKFVRT